MNVNKKCCLNLEDASEIARTAPGVIRRAVRNGLAVPLTPEESGARLRFDQHEVEAWINPTRVRELLTTRMKRGPDAAFLGEFPCRSTYRQKNSFILPFRGRCLVLDGGDIRTDDGRIRNAHYYCEPCYRWASDFIVIHPDDYPKTRIGMGLNEALQLRRRRGQSENTRDFQCSEPENDPMHSYWSIRNPDALEPHLNYLYEVDVIAPADGIFMTRGGGLDDPEFEAEVERLARTGSDDEIGFLLDHGNAEISQIAHVRGRTILVKPGERVKQGQVLCKAGGRHRALPHLHWCVRDSWADFLACGLPISISECMVYGTSAMSIIPEYPSLETEMVFVPRTNVFLQRGMVVGNNWPNNAMHTDGNSATLHSRR